MTSDRHITVVVPTCDRPQLLRRTLRAIFSQDYPGSVDVIVVYDKAEVDTGLLGEFNGAAMQVIANCRTPGPAGARNTGVCAAGGEWVAFCDDDDEWAPHKLSVQMELLKSRPQAGVLASGVTVVYEKNELERVPAHDTITYQMLLRRRVMEAHTSTLVVRKDLLFGSIGLFDEEMPRSYGEDYEWTLRAARLAEVAVAREALVRVLWHPGSYFSQHWRTIIDGTRCLLAKVPDFQQEPAGHARLLGRQAFAYAALGERRSAFAKAWQTFRTDWREKRSYLAVVVAAGLLPASLLTRWANRRGRAI